MKRLARAALVGALAACGGPSAQRVELPATKPPLEIQVGRFDPTANVPVVSQEITFPVEGHTVPATVVHPTTGVWPAIVLMAGSGPTDRDWNNPLITGKNGSGKLLAEALAKRGAVVIRFDKAATAANKLPPEQVTLDTYVDEGRGALTYLRGRPDVDPHHMYLAGHSEGGIHAIRVAIAEGGRIAGLVLLSSAGRTMKDITVGQLDAQFKQAVATGQVPADLAKAQMASISSALDDFVEGRPVDPTAVSAIPAIQQLIGAIVNSPNTKLLRDLFGYDPGGAVGKLRVPVFVFNGLKDMQADPERDAARLEKLLHDAGQDVTLFLAPDANHVLKHETRSTAVLRRDPTLGTDNYNAPAAVLDETTIAALGNWIATHDH